MGVQHLYCHFDDKHPCEFDLFEHLKLLHSVYCSRLHWFGDSRGNYVILFWQFNRECLSRKYMYSVFKRFIFIEKLFDLSVFYDFTSESTLNLMDLILNCWMSIKIAEVIFWIISVIKGRLLLMQKFKLLGWIFRIIYSNIRLKDETSKLSVVTQYKTYAKESK